MVPMQANIVSKASGTKGTPSVCFAKGGWMNFTAETVDDPGTPVGACFQGLRKAKSFIATKKTQAKCL